MLVVLAFLLAKDEMPSAVTVTLIGTTNDASGTPIYVFQVTNGLKESIGGWPMAEVFQRFWFEANPQPVSFDSGEFLMNMPPGGVTPISTRAPAGPVPYGSEQRPNPPGAKWRVRFSYSLPEWYWVMRIRSGFGINSRPTVAYGPEIPFSPANQPVPRPGASGFADETNRTSSAAGSRR
jgi:hypothetical protein